MGNGLRDIPHDAARRVKRATVRFYFDADVLGLGKLIASIRPDATYPGDPGATVHKRLRPPCIVASPDVDDIEWIPRVSADRLIAISRDARIATRMSELETVVEHRARLVILSSRDARTLWTQPEVVMRQWRQIERLVDREGPFIYRVSRFGFERVPLLD